MDNRLFINLAVKDCRVQGSDSGISIIINAEDIEAPLSFPVPSLERLNEFFKVFNYESLSNIKYMRGILDGADTQRLIGFAHITKQQVYLLDNTSKETEEVSVDEPSFEEVVEEAPVV